MNLRSLIPVGRDRVARREGNPFIGLHREMDRLFDDFTRGWPTFGRTWPAGTFAYEPTLVPAMVPTMDITETEKEIEITAELPGLEEKDVEVNVSNNVLTIRGEKKAEKAEKDKDYHLTERSYGSFARTLELPAGVEPEMIKASIANGVLKVTIPKPAPAVTKKVEVKAAA
jgi:HSP20 family protein